jgi:spermidine synthase
VLALLAIGFGFAGHFVSLAEANLYATRTSCTPSPAPTSASSSPASRDETRLYLNHNLQFSSRDEYRYHEALVHPGLAALPGARKILVLGGGDGMAVREILKYPQVEHVTLVDLDPRMTELFAQSPLLRELNGNALAAPKLKIINADALQWLEASTEVFDFVVADFPDPSNHALGKLYSTAFYRLLKQHVAETGLVAVQATSPLYARESFWTVVATLEAAGWRTAPYHALVPSFGEWGYTMFEQAFRNIDDALWKESGCTTELDYTEQTSWLLFLKYLDGLEQDKAAEALLEGKPPTAYILDAPYRWESWAAPKDANGKLDHNRALTGDDLVDFVDRKLFPYLHAFKQRASGPDTIEYKIGEIFGEIKNKIRSGYTLRDIIDHIDELRFRSQVEKHELSALYEEKIKRMGNAGRNGGEYYTPRPLIRAMIQVIQPKIGERIYDGACGSAGFLCEAHDYLRQAQPEHRRSANPAGAHLLRQGEEEPRLRHRDHEHDPARHRSAQHRAHQHPGG